MLPAGLLALRRCKVLPRMRLHLSAASAHASDAGAGDPSLYALTTSRNLLDCPSSRITDKWLLAEALRAVSTQTTASHPPGRSGGRLQPVGSQDDHRTAFIKLSRHGSAVKASVQTDCCGFQTHYVQTAHLRLPFGIAPLHRVACAD